MAKRRSEELVSAATGPRASGGNTVRQLIEVTSAGASVPNISGVSRAAADVASSSLAGASRDFTEQISSLTTQISALTSSQQTQVNATQDNTQALAQNTASKSGGPSIGSTAGGIVSTLMSGGSFLSPILSGFLSLFGGGEGSQAAAPVPFSLPLPIQYNAGLTGEQAAPVNYGESGQPRLVAASVAPQVTIQVNAMDSQSFLDHSDAIASAVKRAILTSNALNDVIADL